MVLIPNLFFGQRKFCSSEYAKFDKNLQKVIALYFVLKDTPPLSFDILNYLFPLEGIPRDFKVHQIS